MKTIVLIEDGFIVNKVVVENIEDIEYLDFITENRYTLVEQTEETGIAYIGFKYFNDLNKFQPFCEYASWTFDKDQFSWIPPISKPQGLFDWNEETLNWVEIQIPGEDA